MLFLVNCQQCNGSTRPKRELADTTNAVRFQMMQNRLYLSNYLLSGDTREVDRMNEGLRTLNDKLDQSKILATRTKSRPHWGKCSNWNRPGAKNLRSL